MEAYWRVGRTRDHGQKKRLKAVNRLTEFYSNSDNRTEDPPDEEFGIGDLDGDLVDQATEILMFLESIEWKWDIQTILDQPNDMTRAVMRLKSLGRKIQQDNEERA